MTYNHIFSLIQNFYRMSCQKRYSYLIAFLTIILFNIGQKLLDFYLGDADGIISGHYRFIVFDVNIILVLWLLISIYFKSNRITDLNLGRGHWIFFISLAFVLRISMALLGGNFDLESYEIVADIVLKGKSVYAHTSRYNYGPIWAYMLAGLKFLAELGTYHSKIFHCYIVTVLFISELIFYRALYTYFKNKFLIILLLLNPVSIVIIGHHSQFDILAICLAFYAFLNIKNDKINLAILFLGLSYCTKHILVFFPLLLLFDSSISFKNRIKLLIIPSLIFCVSFLPFMQDFVAINQNVLSYQFNNNQTFLKQFLDLTIPGFITKMGLFKIIPVFQGYKLIWLLLFPCLGYYLFKWENKEPFFLYLICIVASSLAISEQYFLIPLSAVFIYRKHFFAWAYLTLASYYILFVSYNNTAKYFSLKSMGIAMDFEWYQIGFAQVQMCLFLLLAQILYANYQSFKTKSVS